MAKTRGMRDKSGACVHRQLRKPGAGGIADHIGSVRVPFADADWMRKTT